MKKVTIILSLIVLILLAGEGFYFYTALNKPQPVIQAVPKVEKKAGIVLFKESGDVFYKRPGDSDYIQLSATSMEIPNLTSVKTAIGRGSVLLPSNSVISLSENTELSVNFTDNSTSIFQSAGNTYHRVQALLTGKTYEVQTPGTLAAVRGTKFAVAYDKAKSTTKVAVTEHSVSVARIKKSFEPNATTTETKLEEVQVTEGSSAKITESTTTPATSGGKPTPIDKTPKLVVSKIDDDTELKSWVDENKARDPVLDKLKSDIPDPKIYREQLENTLKSPVPQTKPVTDATKPVTDTTKPVAQDTTKPASDATKPATVTPTKPAVETTPIVVKKLSEEEFFDKFNAVFVKNFYVENDDGICSLTTTSDARVKETSDLAVSSGYPLPAGSAASLKKFSEDIIYYCKNGKGDTKARSALQVRFDDEFPFKNSL